MSADDVVTGGMKRTNERAGVDAGFALLCGFGRTWPGTTQRGR